jgi:hypothetical protein
LGGNARQRAAPNGNSRHNDFSRWRRAAMPGNERHRAATADTNGFFFCLTMINAMFEAANVTAKALASQLVLPPRQNGGAVNWVSGLRFPYNGACLGREAIK